MFSGWETEWIDRVVRLAPDGDSRHLCPACSHDRKGANRRVKCLNLTISGREARWCCHHPCGFQGGCNLDNASTPSGLAVPYALRPKPKSAPPPAPVAETPRPSEHDLDLSVVAWFQTERHISEATLVKAGVYTRSDGNETAILFPYKDAERNEYAAKVRTMGKRFWQEGSCRSFWGQELIQPGHDLIITEGEMDRLAYIEAGHDCVVSVPNGAPVKVGEGEPDPHAKAFQYIYHGRRILDEAKRILISVDTDSPGLALTEELVRRIGKARCWRVILPDDCKDANDALIKYGPSALAKCIEGAEPWPVKGVYDVDHYAERVDALYNNGLGRGVSVGLGPEVDDLYTVVLGQLTVITGTPGSGKTSLLNQMLVNLAKSEGWRFGLFSTETEPDLHIAELCSLYSGKPFFDGPTPRLTKDELAEAKRWVGEHFFFIELDGVPDLDQLIEKLTVAVMRYGIRGAVIDPASYVRPPAGLDMHSEWVGHMLESFKAFGRSHECAMWLVAHPFKMRMKDDGTQAVPKGYDISGSAHWFNRADVGLTVHRPADNRSLTELHTWKIRFRWVGSEGVASLHYDKPTGQFSSEPFGPPEGMVMFSMDDSGHRQMPWDA